MKKNWFHKYVHSLPFGVCLSVLTILECGQPWLYLMTPNCLFDDLHCSWPCVRPIYYFIFPQCWDRQTLSLLLVWCVKWCLVVIVCISVISYDVEHLFMFIRHLGFFHKIFIYTFTHCLWDYWIFVVVDSKDAKPFWLYMLQIFSLSLWLIFSTFVVSFNKEKFFLWFVIFVLCLRNNLFL